MLVSRGVVLLLSPMRFASLAARTRQSTTDIQSMISALQERRRNPLLQSWSKVVGKAHTSVAHAEKQLQLLMELANALTKLPT